VCARECGAKWREINARLRYTDTRYFHFYNRRKNKRDDPMPNGLRAGGRRNSFIRSSGKKNFAEVTRSTCCIVRVCFSVATVFRWDETRE